MIVSYELAAGGLLLREVETEAEAFAEMRRFNAVNHISSDETEVRWVEAKENYLHKIIPRHKVVVMHTMFGIYYDSAPEFLELGSEEQWNIKRDGLIQYNPSYHLNHNTRQYVCWYDEVMTYLKDLEARKAGGG